MNENITKVLDTALERSKTSATKVLISAKHGQAVNHLCKQWAKNKGVNIIYCSAKEFLYDQTSLKRYIKPNSILLCDDFDKADEETLEAILDFAANNSSILFFVAIAYKELPATVSNLFTYTVQPENLQEAIALEADLLLKLKPIPEVDIFNFMQNLRGGTYFNMGMYSSIPLAKAYKKTYRIYKVIDLTAIVSGVSYENIGTTKEFRDRTGEAPGKSWYDHTPGFENKVGQKKSDPNSKYVLWDIKRCSGTCVRYYLVDIDTEVVTPVSKEAIMTSDYITESEKKKLTPTPVVGFDLQTGEAVENKTNWRTVAFDHIFWLNQAGKATQEYGARFEEDLTESFGADLFFDAHANIHTDVDAILSGTIEEKFDAGNREDLIEAPEDIFVDAHAAIDTKIDDDVLFSPTIEPTIETKKLKESYRRIVSRGNALVDNELFVDFE